MTGRITRVAAAALALGLLAGACSDGGDDAADETTTTMEASETTMADDSAGGDDMTDDMTGEDIVDVAAGAGSFSTLISAVQAAGLEETLRGDGPFTVFAPTDSAFASLPDGTIDMLLDDPEGQLTDILTYHVVEGEVMAADVVGMDGQEVTTLNGATFTVNVSDDGKVTLTDGAGTEVLVSQTDVDASNGVVHVVDSVLMPG